MERAANPIHMVDSTTKWRRRAASRVSTSWSAGQPQRKKGGSPLGDPDHIPRARQTSPFASAARRATHHRPRPPEAGARLVPARAGVEEACRGLRGLNEDRTEDGERQLACHRTRAVRCPHPLPRPRRHRRAGTQDRGRGPPGQAPRRQRQDPRGQARGRVVGANPRQGRPPRARPRLRDTEPAPFARRIIREAERRGFDKVSKIGDHWARKRRENRRMNYPKFRAMGLCVATGVVEGGCKKSSVYAIVASSILYLGRNNSFARR